MELQKLIFVETPIYADKTPEAMENRRTALECGTWVEQQHPHSYVVNLLPYLPQIAQGDEGHDKVLDNTLRQIALESCEAMYVFGGKTGVLTDDMVADLTFYRDGDIPVHKSVYVEKSLFKAVKKLFAGKNSKKRKSPIDVVTFDFDYADLVKNRNSHDGTLYTLAGDIISQFESVLAVHDVKWDNPQREKYEKECGVASKVCTIFGDEYEELAADLCKVLETTLYYA